MVAQGLRDRYLRAKELGINIVEMDPSTLAGYYLYEYSGDPVSALNIDMYQESIPITVGKPAKLIILSSMMSKVGEEK